MQSFTTHETCAMKSSNYSRQRLCHGILPWKGLSKCFARSSKLCRFYFEYFVSRNRGGDSYGTCLIKENSSNVVTNRQLRLRSTIQMFFIKQIICSRLRQDQMISLYSGSAIKILQLSGFPHECLEIVVILFLASCNSFRGRKFHMASYPCQDG